MTRHIRISEPASAEFTDAVRWYEKRRPGLGAEFFDAVVATIDLVEHRPGIGTASYPDPKTRRMLVSRFPYQVVYRFDQSEVVVVAVSHLKRRPGYWKYRN